MENKINIRYVDEQINNINYDYNILYSEIENIMKSEGMIDLGENKFSFFGLFDIKVDVIPDIIERKSVITLVVNILEHLKNLEISYKSIRFKINLEVINENRLNIITINNNSSNEIKILLNELYKDRYKTDVRFFNYNFNNQKFVYSFLLLLSILEKSSLISMSHQLNVEAIKVEKKFNSMKIKDDTIQKIIDVIGNN